MHFVSDLSKEEQISDVLNFFRDNLQESVSNPKSPAIANLNEKLN